MNMWDVQDICSLLVVMFEVMFDTLHYVLVVSNAVGYFIVHYGLKISKEVINIFKLVSTILQILYEDGLVFLHDVGFKCSSMFNYFLSSCTLLFTTIYNALDIMKNTCVFIYQAFLSTYNFVSMHTWRAWVIVSNIPDFLKQMCIVIGNGVWLALQIIPLAVVYVCSMTIFLVGRSFEELKSLTVEGLHGLSIMCSKIIAFVTDIPPESMIGVFVGILTVCFMVKHYYIIICNAIFVLKYSQQKIGQFLYCIWRGLENTILSLVTNQNRLPPAEVNLTPRDQVGLADESDSETDASVISEGSTNNVPTLRSESTMNKTRKLRLKLVEEQENKLCVVCQDNGKDIIIFPCRHVCLCADCSTVIKNRHGTCPICRVRVSRTMRVYL